MRERLDKTDTVRDMRETYDKWMDVVDGKLLFLQQQVKEGVASMSSPETASLQDIFKAMATKVRKLDRGTLIYEVVLQANQHWDPEADALVKNDLERTQSLFLAAPSVSRRVNKLKVNIIIVNLVNFTTVNIVIANFIPNREL